MDNASEEHNKFETPAAHTHALAKSSFSKDAKVSTSDEERQAISIHFRKSESDSRKATEIVVFDFDGTCIRGNSPVLLVKYLLKKGKVRPDVLARILMWGIAYKTHLPQNEAWVRGLVFRSFAGMDKAQADAEMHKFYDEWVRGRIRKKAIAVMEEHIAAGREVWIVSATFDPIIERARGDIPYTHHCATSMKLDEHGKYTRYVEGAPVEGAEKLRRVEEHANEVYGPGNWRLVYAYGDHYSDATLLNMAEHPCAVTPDHTLQKLAEREGWQILDWKQEKSERKQ